MAFMGRPGFGRGRPGPRHSNRIPLPPEGEPGFLVFESMTPADVNEVAEIEEASFPTPYTPQIFRDELREGWPACWWVVRHDDGRGGRGPAPIVAYIGYYLQRDRAHIAKIATHPGWRRRRLGEWLLLNTLLVAREQGAAYVSLEVRESNTAAQRLYFKWGFVQLRRFRGYYEDTGEDGLILVFTGLADRRTASRLRQELAGVEIVPPAG
ncbi:ribosomal protein S18-alanine N-acetyltransferase [Nonomuraea zeae]|nr:ribosomal protein S18-alanine N-acetyltransferase [Nonomuraea zeae]